MQKQFDIYFKNLFPRVKESSNIFLSSNFLVTNTKDFENVKIDFDNPNKWIKKDLPNKITQLMHCCQLSKIEDVKKLLQANVDVNTKKLNDNCTALICCFGNNYNITKNQIEIMELLIPKMSIDALNAKLIKKNETAMSYAIENGLVDIVKLLIDNNVDLNEKCTLDEISYLYYCIQLIYFSNLNLDDYLNFLRYGSKSVSSSQKESSKIIQANPLINNIFDNEIQLNLSNMINNPRHKPILDDIQKVNHKRYKDNFSVILLDIDDFKPINDTYGHLEGDQCLKAISKVFQDTIRNPEDHVARFGGEEFVILLPGCKAEAAACVGKKLIENVDALSVCKDSVLYGKNVTISVGLASVIPDKKSHMHDFLDQADQALYESKAEGRHCLRVYASFEN